MSDPKLRLRFAAAKRLSTEGKYDEAANAFGTVLEALYVNSSVRVKPSSCYRASRVSQTNVFGSVKATGNDLAPAAGPIYYQYGKALLRLVQGTSDVFGAATDAAGSMLCI